MDNCNTCTALKPLSPSQETELAEGRKVRNILIAFFALPLLCGTVLTIIMPKLIKHIGGIDSFGFPFRNLVEMHLAIFWLGAVICTAIIAFGIWRTLSAFR